MSNYESITPLISDYKVNTVIEASTQKKDGLRQASEAIQLRRLEEAAIDARAMVRNSELDTVTGTLDNATLALMQGGARIASNVATLSDNAEASKYLSYLSDDVRNALYKEQKGEALSPEEQALLEQPINVNQQTNSPNKQFDVSFLKEEKLMSPRDIFSEYQKTNASAQETKDSLTKDTWLTEKFNELNRQNLTKDLNSTFAEIEADFGNDQGVIDNASSVISAISNTIEALWDNPAATLEYTAESAPNIATALNPLTAATNSAAFTTDLFGQNLRNKDDAGEVVDTDKQREFLREALLGGGMEYASNVLLASASGLKGAVKGVKETAEEAVKKTASKGVLASTGSRTAKAAGSTVNEAVTEGVQTAIENDALGKDFDYDKHAREIYQGAAIGFGSSAATVTPSTAIGNTKDVIKGVENAANKKVEQSQEQQKATQTKRDEALTQFLESGDSVTYLQQSTSEIESDGKFDLNGKLDSIAALHKEEADRDSPDYEKGRQLVTAYIEVSTAASQQREANVARLVEIADELQQGNKDDSDVQILNDESTQLQQDNQEIDAALARADAQTDLVLANQQKIKKVSESVSAVTSAESRTPDLEIHAQRIIDESMLNPDGLDVEQMQALIESDNLTDAERTQLTAVAAAKSARDEVTEQLQVTSGKTTEEVQSDVIQGGKGKKGANQYRQQIATALLRGDTLAASSARQQLANFTERHLAKARDFKAAFAPFQRRLDDGANAAPITAEETNAIKFVADTYKSRTRKGEVGFQITANSKNVVDTIGLEAVALQATLVEIDVMIANSDLVKRTPTVTPNPETVTEPVNVEQGTVNEAVPTAEAETTTEAAQEGTQETLPEQEPDYSPSKEILATDTDGNLNRWFRGREAKGVIGKVQNAVARLSQAPETILEHVPGLKELSPTQENAVKNFTAFTQVFNKKLESLYKPLDPKYHYKEPIHYLTDGQQFTPAALEAMSSAAYSWVAFEGADTMWLDKKGVAGNFGLKKEQVTRELYDLMHDKGITSGKVAAALGRQVTSTLGITFQKETSSRSKQSELELAIGNYVLGSMIDSGLVKVTTMKANELVGLVPTTSNESNEPNDSQEPDSDLDTLNKVRHFVRLAGDPTQPFENRFPKNVDSIVQANRDTDRILAKAFDAVNVPTAPSFEPVINVPQKQKNTQRNLSQKIQNIIKTAQQKAWILSEGTDSLFMVLPERFQEAISGVVNDTADMPQSMRLSQEGKNEALRREIRNFKAFRESVMEKGKDTPFYFAYEVWKNQRVGVANTLVNPQASKVHRALVGLRSWKKTLKLDNPKHMEAFKLSVAQGFGVDIDKLTKAASLAKFNEVINNPVMEQAIEATRLLSNPTERESLSAREIDALSQDIAAGVKLGGEDAHTFHALVNYARYVTAYETGTASFVTDSWTEIDGITNGPVIGMLQFMNGSVQHMQRLLQKAGIFFGNENSFGSFTGSDLYTTLGVMWDRALNKGTQEYALLSSVLGDVNRKLSKNPLMTNIYGAGIEGILAQLGETFFEKLDEKLHGMSQPERVELIQSLQGITKVPLYDLSKPLNNQTVNPAAAVRIRNSINDVYKASLEQAITQMFDGFMTNRTQFNRALQQMNSAYIKVAEELLSKREAELKADGTIKANESLPEAQREAVLQQISMIMPGIKTLFSNQANEQLQLTKTEMKPARYTRDGVPNTSRVSFSRPLKGMGQKLLTFVPSTESFVKKLGVGGAITNIHSLDATVALSALANLDVLNVHDGFPSGVLDAESNAQKLNTYFLKAMQQANPYRDLGKMAEVALINLEDLIQKGQVVDSVDAKKQLISAIQLMQDMDYQTAGVRKELYSSINYITQYNLEDGGISLKKPTVEEQVAEAAAPEKPTESIWGKVRSPEAKVTAPFTVKLEALAAKSDHAKTILTELFKGREVQSVQATVIKQLLENIPNNLKIKVVTPNSPPTGDQDLDKEIYSSHGLYNPKNGTIYLRSSEFVADGTNVETVAHELIHAMTIIEMAKARDTTGKYQVSDRSKKAVAALDDLLTQVKEQVEARGIAVNQNALENTEEFIAYALTNEEFQMALKGLKIKPSKRNIVVNAFDQFVNALSDLLFKSKAPRLSNALNEAILLSGVVLAEQNKIVNQPKVDLTTRFSQRIQRLTTAEIFAALGQQERQTRSDSHIQAIEELQNTLVNSITGPNGFDLNNAEENLGDEVDSYLESLRDNKRPFVSSIKRVFNLTAQEAYVAEQLEAVFGSALSKYKLDVKLMDRLWKQAKQQLRPENFLADPRLANDTDAMAKAQAQYDFIFEPKLKNQLEIGHSELAGKTVVKLESDYLQRFAVLATTHEPFIKLLETLTPSDARASAKGSFIKQIAVLVEKMLQGVQEIFQRTNNPKGNMAKQARTLLENIAKIERNKRKRAYDLTAISETVHDKANNALSTVMKTGLTAISLSGLKESKIGVVRATASAAEVIAKDRSNAVTENLYKIRDRIAKDRHGFTMQLVEEMRAITPTNMKFMNLLRWANRDGEQKRRQVKEWIRDEVKDSFARKLSSTEQSAITKVFIQGDLESLMADYNLDELLSDPEKLQAAIADLEAEIGDSPNSTYYINQADALGLYMVKGRAANNLLSKNAHAIARMFGLPDVVPETDAAAVTPTINKLASLRAITYMSDGNKEIALELLRSEQNRDDGGNGIEFTLLQHRVLKEEALMHNFDNDPALMQKGYVYQMVNPHLTVRWAATGSQEANDLLAQGYTESYAIGRDDIDPENTKATMYVREDGGQMNYVTGIVSLTNKSAKGTRVSQSQRTVGTNSVELTVDDDIERLTEAALAQAERLKTERVPAGSVKGNKVIPLFNPDGAITDFRYEMEEANRELVLEKAYEVSDILGAMAGSIVDKSSTENINAQTVEALFQQYDADKDVNPERYVAIEPNSADSEIRQIWAMMPHGTRQAIVQKFGQPKLMVRKELMTLVFGYRKASVGNLWQRDLQQLNNPQKWLRIALEMTLGKVVGAKLELRLRQAENIWQTLITMVKDIFVVKNIFTTVGNIMSNAALLMWSGVPLHHIVTHQAEGWTNAQRYNNHKKEAHNIENRLKLLSDTHPDRKALVSRLNLVNHKMATNPVHELMEAGMFQTIVEDIDADIDPYSFKSKFIKDMESKFGKLFGEDDTKQEPKNDKFKGVREQAKTLGKYLFITQDTKLYKLMNHPIQMSDFAARYAQFKYLTEVQANPLSKEDALKQITENFINYDVPTQQSLQYLNDMGLVMFSKYFLRIQKPLLNLFLEKPANLLMMLASQSHFGFSAPTDSSLLDNSILNRFHNPIGNMLEAPDEIATINALLHATGIK